MKPIRLAVMAMFCGCSLAALADSTVTTTVDGQTDSRTLSKITFDGNNVTLTFDDASTLTADMSLVSVALDHTNATALNELLNDSSKPSGVYNLKGQRIAETPAGLEPGVYISNGQKILVK